MNIRIILTAATALTACGAFAYPTMNFLGTVDGQGVKMSLNSGSSFQSVFAGELQMRVNYSPSSSEIIVGYCADPRTVMANSTYDIDITDSSSIADVGSKLGHMVNTYAPALLLDGQDTNAMALQVAIWEVLVETSGIYDVTDGLFQAKQADGNAFSASDLTAINGYLNSVGEGTALLYRSGVNGNGNSVSQSILTPVPEPATIGVLAIGALSMLRRRRNR